MSDELTGELLKAYESAKERTRALRDEWEALGGVVMPRGSPGQPVVHPIHRALIEAERHENHLRQGCEASPVRGVPPRLW